MIKRIVILASLFLSLSANSTIVDLGIITHDTDTGNYWLDLSETQGRSYADVSNQLGMGGEFEGWRYATYYEVYQLWRNLGLSDFVLNNGIALSDTVTYAVFKNAVSLLGNTRQPNGRFPGDIGSIGITASIYGIGEQVKFGHYFLEYNQFSTVDYGGLSQGLGDQYVGSYLVASTMVPVPAALWLFGSSLICLVGIKRKK